MENSTITINTKSKLINELNLHNGDTLTEEEAHKVAEQINSSHKGKAIVENNQLKVKDLIIG